MDYSDLSKKDLIHELKESKNINFILTDNLSDIIWMLDMRFKPIYVSSSVKRMLGYNIEEVLINNPKDYLTPNSLEKIKKIFHSNSKPQKAFQSYLGKEFDIELEIFCKDGSIVSSSNHIRFIDDFYGNPHVVVGITRDITEHKRIESELHEAYDYFYQVTSSANVMIIGLDARGRIKMINQAAENITGYSILELINTNWFTKVVPKDKYPLVWEIFHNYQKGNLQLPRNFENPILTKSGEERYISWQNSMISSPDKSISTISFGIDITMRKQAEKALREKQIALTEVLKHLQAEIDNYKEEISAQIKDLFCPIIKKLREKSSSLNSDEIDTLEYNFNNIINKNISALKNDFRKLSPREIDIVEMIKKGKSSKDIAGNLNISLQTVEKHRKSIRKKLQIKNRSINLSTYLRSL